MTPLERAARALYRSAPHDFDPNQMGENDTWSDLVNEVRAVLQAIREPSEATEIAVAEAIQRRLPCDSGNDPPDVPVMVEYGVSKAAIAAMIDAALEEG